MLCDVCQRTAAGRCNGCNAYYCPDHGGQYCFRCAATLVPADAEIKAPALETAVYTVDRASRWAGRGYLQCTIEPGMPTVYLDDRGPPACGVCGGLARKICSHCLSLFCPEHAGTATLCQSCVRSSRMGIFILAAVFLLFGLLVLLLGRS